MKKIKLIIRLVLSIGLVILLLYTSNLEELLETLRRGQPLYLLIALMIGFGDRILMAVKWNLLLRVKNIEIPHSRAIATYWKSTFFGLILPATVGGDAVRAYAVSRDGHNFGEIVSSIVVERLLGFVALFSFVCVSITLSLAVFGQSFFPGIEKLFWLFLILLLGSSTILWFSLNRKVVTRVISIVDRYFPNLKNYKFSTKLGQLYQSYLSYDEHRNTLIFFYTLSVIESLFPLFWTFFLALAFNIEVPLLFFFILIPIVLVLVRLPISIDGFGLQEGAFVFFLGLIGISAEEALLLGLASHFLGLFSIFPGGIFYAFGGMNMKEKEQLEAANQYWQG